MLLVGPERERGVHVGEEVAPHGAVLALAATLSRDRGWSPVLVSLMGQRVCPLLCVCLYESQKPNHPEGSSEPLGDLSSHPLPPYVSACRSCISLDPLATHSMSAKNFSVLAHIRVLSPSELKVQPHSQITLRSAGELLWS